MHSALDGLSVRVQGEGGGWGGAHTEPHSTMGQHLNGGSAEVFLLPLQL